MSRTRNAAYAVIATLALSAPAMAQNVTTSDIQRLQDNVYQAGNDVSQLRGRDSTRAGQLQTELDDLRDEVIYLKVKLRKNNSLTRSEYADVRDRIEALRTRARNDSYAAVTPAPSTGGASTSATSTTGTRSTTGRAGDARPGEVPTGTELDV